MKNFYIVAVKIKKSDKEVIKVGTPEPGMVAHSQHSEGGSRIRSSKLFLAVEWVTRLREIENQIKEAARTPSLLPCIIFLLEVKQAVSLVSHLRLYALHGYVCACV